MIQNIETKHSKDNPGHYSPGVIHNGVLYVSGQLSKNPETGEVPTGGIIPETKQALTNMLDVIETAGSKKENVLKVTIYVPEIKDWPIINDVYREFFGEHKPARVVVPTRDLHYGCLVEIDCICAMDA